MINVELEAADGFHALRENSSWVDADQSTRVAALYRASDYVEAVYAIDGLEEDARVQMAVTMLAAEMLTASLSVAAPTQAVLSEELEAGDGAFREKKTYAARASDPYPLITAILSPIPRRVDLAAREASQVAPSTLSTLRLRRA